ncbi:hypothetical protein ACTFIV_004106 [Dictyostelium citrinum]
MRLDFQMIIIHTSSRQVSKIVYLYPMATIWNSMGHASFKSFTPKLTQVVIGGSAEVINNNTKKKIHPPIEEATENGGNSILYGFFGNSFLKLILFFFSSFYFEFVLSLPMVGSGIDHSLLLKIVVWFDRHY